MEREQLKSLLERLRDELEETGDVDTELRKLLSEVDADIDDLLAKSGPDPERPQVLSERVRDAATGFAARHPRLESALLELSEVLGRMGI